MSLELQKRIIIHLGLLRQVEDEVSKIRVAMLDNKGPLRPDTIDCVVHVLDVLQMATGPS